MQATKQVNNFTNSNNSNNNNYTNTTEKDSIEQDPLDPGVPVYVKNTHTDGNSSNNSLYYDQFNHQYNGSKGSSSNVSDNISKIKTKSGNDENGAFNVYYATTQNEYKYTSVYDNSKGSTPDSLQVISHNSNTSDNIDCTSSIVKDYQRDPNSLTDGLLQTREYHNKNKSTYIYENDNIQPPFPVPVDVKQPKLAPPPPPVPSFAGDSFTDFAAKSLPVPQAPLLLPASKEDAVPASKKDPTPAPIPSDNGYSTSLKLETVPTVIPKLPPVPVFPEPRPQNQGNKSYNFNISYSFSANENINKNKPFEFIDALRAELIQNLKDATEAPDFTGFSFTISGDYLILYVPDNSSIKDVYKNIDANGNLPALQQSNLSLPKSVNDLVNDNFMNSLSHEYVFLKVKNYYISRTAKKNMATEQNIINYYRTDVFHQVIDISSLFNSVA
jgi:hypothetical protein